jgi:hypothetical protein
MSVRAAAPGALRLLALAGLVLALVPSVARAGDIEDFETARAAYESRDFQRAVYYFEELVGGEIPRLTSPALVVEARKYLGASYLFVGQRESARRQFELLLRSRPDYQLDPLLFPSEVLELFSAIRERLELEQREAAARRELEARTEREIARSRALVAFAEEDVRLEVEGSRALALFPFGVGQFLNGDEPLGWVFLLGEAVLGATAIGALAWHQSLVPQVLFAQTELLDQRLVARGNDLLRAAEITNWVALSSFGVLLVAGVLEAQIRFVPSRTVVERRRVPDELREGLGLEEEPPAPAASPTTLRIGPAGLGIGASTTF